jgi:TatA/E family protein of Tat protein translocase
MNFGIWELSIVAAVAFLFFGHRLPGVMKDLAKGIRGFKEGLRDGENETETVKISQP